jgi:DNA-binding LacI/PurR family transcriptional regulator
MNKVTLKDVARAAGVSRATASNVFAHPERVRAELRERVEAIARDMHYFGPDAKGRLLREGRFHALGVVAPSGFGVADAVRNPIFRMFLEGVAEVCDEAGVNLVVTPDPVRGKGLSTALADAFILSRAEHVRDLEPLRRRRAAFVVIDFDPGPEIGSVRVDAWSGARAVIDHLTALGHRRFVIISFMRSFGDTKVHPPAPGRSPGIFGGQLDQEKMRGYADGLAAVGIDIDSVPVVETHPWAEDAARLALDLSPRATAVVSMSAMQALAVLREARRRGLVVPRDLSVAGFNDVPEAAISTPSLTTVDSMTLAKGREAARMVLSSGPPRTEILATRLVVRESTGRAPD